MAERVLAIKNIEEHRIQIKEKGISFKEINRQLDCFKKGFSKVKLLAAAEIGNGVLQFDEKEIENHIKHYEKLSNKYRITKFIPASGAATRMLKFLFTYIKEAKKGKELETFKSSLPTFPFYQKVITYCEKEVIDLSKELAENDLKKIIHFVIGKDGLNYQSLPKGMIDFHQYEEYNRTPFEEHLVEGALYAQATDHSVNIHFTVAPEHKEKIKTHIDSIVGIYEKKYNVSYTIDYSVQNTSTDTLAVDLNNEPFLLDDGSLFFRPGGHGALIDNLNNISSDIVFIKNIDNVVHDRLKEPTIKYKKALAGLLMEIKSTIHHYLTKIDNDTITDAELKEALAFTQSIAIDTKGTDKERIFNELNRPVRVCGMVKNQGEPGGGPFWVNDSKNHKSLQIIEKSQIDLSDTKQQEILDHSTHFNPVDLVCSITNYKKEAFNLLDYVDEDTGFISEKSMDGKDLKALERPGLWNGAMAKWITVFVEIPLITFNPVKTINDLLRDAHQAS
ncbi:MAG: DUF4301 family protein [Cyclobacteriaceae bacterium]